MQAKESWEMSDEEKVAAAAKRKEAGNASFKVKQRPRSPRYFDILSGCML